MGKYVANEITNLMTKKRIPVVDSNILIMGFTFKAGCPDLRNTRVVDVFEELSGFHCNIDVYDPWIDKEESIREYGITPVEQPEQGKYDAVIIAVEHHQFKAMGIDAIRALGKENHVLYDIKYILPAKQVDGRL
jgi:UDP-N-acetyl-D-galactosamine dehydrogenase